MRILSGALWALPPTPVARAATPPDAAAAAVTASDRFAGATP